MEPFSNAGCSLALTFLLCLQQPWSGRGGNEGELAVLLVQSGDLAEVGWFNGSGALLAVRLASHDISSDDSLLADRKPVLLEEETSIGGCLTTNHSVVAILSEFSNTTRDIWTQFSNLSVISYSPVCLNESSLPPSSRYFCMQPSSEHLPAGIAALISYYGWQRAAMISEEGSSFVLRSEDLVTELNASGVSDVRESSVSMGPLPNDIFHRDYHIVVLNLTPSLSRLVLCEAFHQSLRYVWILPGWFPHGWWMESSINNSSSSSCSDEELEEFMGTNMLSVAQSPIHHLTDVMSGLRNSSSFQEWCDSRDIEDCAYAGYAYDAMWAVAISLNNSWSTDNLFMSIAESNFSGVSGQVVFDLSGYRQLGGFRVSQYRNEGQLERVQIATLTPDQEGRGRLVFSYCCNESAGSVWPQGVPPDGSPLRELKHPILGLVILCYSLSIAVILFAVICIIFNIRFRKKKLIKLTSPNLNHMIAIGAILMNIGSLMTMYPPIYGTALSVLCPVRSWLIPIGWSLCLCTIAVKMWRVYIIYRTANKLQTMKHKKLKGFLRDWNLMVFIGGLVVVDLLVLVVGTAVPSSRFKPEEVEDKEFPPIRNEEGIQVKYYNLQCITKTGLYWVAVLFGYKVLLQISGMVLAFLTRKIEVKGLNESREVQVVMIITTPLVVVAMVLRLVFDDYLNVVGTSYGLGTAIVTGLALAVIFIPKMVELYKNPSGEHIFLSRYHHENIATSRRDRFRGRSVTSSSLVATFSPTSTLRGFFRSMSVGNKIVVSTEKETVEKEDVQVVKNVHFLLPQIEEASNEATTDGSQNAVDYSLLPQGGEVTLNRYVDLESSNSSTAEENITSRAIITSTNHPDKMEEEEKDSINNSVTSKTTAAANILLNPSVDPGPVEQSVIEDGEMFSNGSLSHSEYLQTASSVVVSASVCTGKEEDHDDEEEEEVTSPDSSQSGGQEHTSLDVSDSESSDNR